ncbi:hypothetical protein GCM10007874_64740 [Labrys miyagiensis]|uniref:Uncharacterized protein n=1 Tax=Labrys miyagiensis TaxID=346912 RepID=A0ABQ6CUG4_9HYPH|nr:hypothetical protein [Labrys miyagiensis]GLS23453.1 hypothetical protein GCM10007874_64740 [Labrys miyagiensis]
MDIEGSRLQQPASVKRERLEDRYGKIAMPALAAAVGSASKEKNQRQMSAEAALTRLQQMAQD